MILLFTCAHISCEWVVLEAKYISKYVKKKNLCGKAIIKKWSEKHMTLYTLSFYFIS